MPPISTAYVLPLFRSHLQQRLAAKADVPKFVASPVDRFLGRVLGSPGASLDLGSGTLSRVRKLERLADAGILRPGHHPGLQPVANDNDPAGRPVD